MATCHVCGKDSPDGFQFCGFCGATLAGADAASAARERKVVTVLFCDLVGFTAASESADPEEVQARMAPYHARARERIEAFGGTVEKFIGDAVMGVFGAPIAHEDDAERAVRAGLAILEGIDELNATDGALALSVRIGVNTGEAVVSLDARPELGEGMVTGDVVNTAARIQSAAPVDGVAVGEATFRATDRIFEYAELDPIAAKGKAEPVPIWKANAPVARFGSDVIRSLTTPLVGRETDLALLRSLFDKSACDRDVQLVTVVGEPGVGKSRLVAELFAYIDERDELVTWRQGRCLPYGEGITFWALGEIVKAHAGIYESDSPDEAGAKLDALLPEGTDREWLRARLEPLIGIESAQPPSREESFTAWRRFLEGIAEEGPFVLVVEDIHWADDALLEFLEHVADWAQGVSLLVVCTARPELYERHPSWGAGLSNATAIRLSPLSDRDTARLVAGLLGQAVLPAETQQVLLERAGGNPLYAEEFVRMLRDQDLLDDHGGLREGVIPSLPDSIQALIAARIDTLASDRKRLLQDAAVIGKVFWAGAVDAMGDLDAPAVEVALHELVRKELVRPSRQSSMEKETEYGFWHALVRDVAYQQIPRSERADKHVSAAEWIEGRSAERLEDVADVLVHHYETASELYAAAGNADRAAVLLEPLGRSLRLAAARAAVLDATLAADLYARSVASVAADDPTRGDLLLEAFDALRQAARREEGHAVLDEAEAWFRSRGDDVGAARVLLARSRIRHWSQPGDATDAVIEALRLLEGMPGPELARAYAEMALTEYIHDHNDEVIYWADRSLNLSKELGLTEEIDAIGARGGARAARGDRDGVEDIRRAVELALALQATTTAVRWLNNLAAELYLWEGAASALEVIHQALALTDERGIVSLSIDYRGPVLEYLYDLGRWDDLLAEGADLEQVALRHGLPRPPEAWIHMSDVLASRGDLEAAKARFDEMLAESRRIGEAQFVLQTLSVVAATELAGGDSVRAGALLDELLDLPELRSSLNFPPYLPEIVRTAIGVGGADLAAAFLEGFEAVAPMHVHARRVAEASIAEARGEHSSAARTYDEAADAWREFGFVPEEAFALLGRGRCLVALGDPGADLPLCDARAIFDRLGMRPRVDECDSLIARASRLSS